jgi:hypothetical protein
LLRDADPTLLATIDQLITANLYIGKKENVLGLLNRILKLQIVEYGAGDVRSLATSQKIELLEANEDSGDKSDCLLYDADETLHSNGSTHVINDEHSPQHSKTKRKPSVLTVFKGRRKNAI